MGSVIRRLSGIGLAMFTAICLLGPSDVAAAEAEEGLCNTTNKGVLCGTIPDPNACTIIEGQTYCAVIQSYLPRMVET